MKRCKYFWIKERHNPQTGVYYVAMGKIPIKKAEKHENGALYGYNIMHRFANIADYNNRVKELKDKGERVYADV